jgi:hypothetical protein
MKMKSIENAVKKLGLVIERMPHGEKMWRGFIVGSRYTCWFYQYIDADYPSSISIRGNNIKYDYVSDYDNNTYPDTIKEIIYYLTK